MNRRPNWVPPETAQKHVIFYIRALLEKRETIEAKKSYFYHLLGSRYEIKPQSGCSDIKHCSETRFVRPSGGPGKPGEAMGRPKEAQRGPGEAQRGPEVTKDRLPAALGAQGEPRRPLNCKLR